MWGMTGLVVLVLLVAALGGGLEARHRRSGEAVLRRLRAASHRAEDAWWPPGPVVRRS
jgi:hypothetical protein